MRQSKFKMVNCFFLIVCLCFLTLQLSRPQRISQNTVTASTTDQTPVTTTQTSTWVRHSVELKQRIDLIIKSIQFWNY
ncbi:hypothetical protein FHQ08_09700 [Lactobacillus sp. CC-MHH1034]|uniref:hypothetical protein n=1 Tax=Agrilactobacillus fermenti TaxID=2586909 RepID=UPI001E4FE5AD|nr:hypothetical protein [Agrilactobacillus fermenti]MCD2256996.1 hypothetical protein [Agrilactobacillus fermenti]